MGGGSYTLLEKRLLTPGMRHLFGDHSYSICLCCLVGRIYVFNVYFGKFVITFIEIGEIGCMSIPKCHLIMIAVNRAKQA